MGKGTKARERGWEKELAGPSFIFFFFFPSSALARGSDPRLFRSGELASVLLSLLRLYPGRGMVTEPFKGQVVLQREKHTLRDIQAHFQGTKEGGGGFSVFFSSFPSFSWPPPAPAWPHP